MNETKREKVYEAVLQMVVWDEPRENVFQKLNASGLYDDEAQAMYNKAMKERISSIRSDHWAKLLKGLFILSVSIGVFINYWEGAGAINRNLFITCFLGTGFGLWKSCEGLIGVLMAKHQRGSLADME